MTRFVDFTESPTRYLCSRRGIQLNTDLATVVRELTEDDEGDMLTDIMLVGGDCVTVVGDRAWVIRRLSGDEYRCIRCDMTEGEAHALGKPIRGTMCGNCVEIDEHERQRHA